MKDQNVSNQLVEETDVATNDVVSDVQVDEDVISEDTRIVKGIRLTELSSVLEQAIPCKKAKYIKCDMHLTASNSLVFKLRYKNLDDVGVATLAEIIATNVAMTDASKEMADLNNEMRVNSQELNTLRTRLDILLNR